MAGRILSTASICLLITTAEAVAQEPRAPVAPVGALSLPTIDIFATTPLPGSGTDIDKIPAAVTVINPQQIERTQSLNITDALTQYVPSITVGEVAGNPFQPDVQFRGFTASPVAGTPQGLAVYQNGVRINEAFGDTVNWDLIPTVAIRSINVVTNNPAFGLNALGGAISVQMKDGFSYQGAETSFMGGSFGRAQGSAQWGQQVGAFAAYGALEGLRDEGFRDFSQSRLRRFYGDIGYRGDRSEFHLNMGAANNMFGAAGTSPVELLQQRWANVYTTPQTSNNRVAYLNATGKIEATPTWTIESVASIRAFRQKTTDGNPTNAEPCIDPLLLCFGDDTTPANGLNGMQLANTFDPAAILGQNDRTSTRSVSTGLTLQATNTDEVFGRPNHFVIGGNLVRGITNFNASAELGTIGNDFVVSGSGIFLGPSGEPVSIGPVSLRTKNIYSGVYALDTFDVTQRLSVTAGGRFNHANIKLEDQLGTALNGEHNFARLNPIFGATYKVTPSLTAYAGYSEANRAPTPLELACSDPARPCIIATFLVSDPPLKQVVSRTVEAGFRGKHEFAPQIGTLDWKLGAFRTANHDDILAIPSPVVQGFGYFQNVGQTLRQGIEAQANLRSSKFHAYASYAYIDATFRNPILLGSNSPFADGDGNLQVMPGNRIPAIPRHRFKAGFDYFVTDAFKVGADALVVGSQFFFGDDTNQFPKLPSYTVVNLNASYQFSKTFQFFARAENVFDRRYATFGTFFDTDDVPNFTNGGAEFTDPRSLSPARPRAIYAGLRAKF